MVFFYCFFMMLIFCITINNIQMFIANDFVLADDDISEKAVASSIPAASPLLLAPAPEICEHIVKSPPEPTRVKSPEQILMRSPDPVNWTVPLDTGKTFTVTQNVRDGITNFINHTILVLKLIVFIGDPNMSRPQSEFKASTPIDKPPSAPLSAPPELAEQAKLQGKLLV